MTVKSGYLNNPPKVIVIEGDNRPGSYPGLSSPRDISRSGETTRPYRDDISPASRSPYATGKINFLRDTPYPATTITITSSSGKISVFTFTRAMVTTSAYDINISDLPRGGTRATSESIRVANQVADRFVSAVSRVPECEITAEKGLSSGEVILRQTIPGSAGNTTITTTVSSARMSVKSFSGGSNVEVRYPYGIPLSDTDPQSSEIIRRFIKSERSGTLSAPGDPDPMRFTAPADQHPYTLHSPYNESNSEQSFGANGGSDTYGTQTELYSNFFTRGSTLGPLDEPLWVKDKIEIDLTPVSETSLLSTTGSSTPGPSSNFPMAYFSFDTRRWEPIGFGHGRNLPAGATTLQENLERQYLGFSQGWGNNLENSSTSQVEILDPQLLSTYTGTKKVFKESGWFSPIDTFGFPLHPKYHATGSQQLNVTSLIDRPFLIEKIVYEFSASMPNLQSSLSAGNFYLGGGGAFFILNQRKANPDPGQENSYTNTYVSEKTSPNREFGTPRDGGSDGPSGDFYSFHYENGSIPRTMQLSTSGPSVYVDTIRDLVTFARVGTVWDTYDDEIDQFLEPGFPHPANFMDLAINVSAGGTFSGKYTVAAPVRAPSQNSAIANIEIGSPPVSPNNITSVWAAKDSSTRNSIDISTGRSHTAEFFGPEISYRCKGWATSKLIFAPKSDNIASPYLILPGDKLVFGWQSPMSYILNDIDKSKTLKILPGAGKLTLYGSYLQDNKPVHNIYKDQLISDSIHEAIPAGPAVLDKFDTEPTIVFSGSMREEYVRGEMFERRSTWYGDTSLIPVSVDSKKVRKVRGRASDGNLGKRASFFRNIRLFQTDEQYYDSMQPDPVKSLLHYNGSTNFIIKNYLPDFPTLPRVNFLFLGAPGDTIVPGISPTAAALAAGTNRVHIGSFPFDPSLYNGIERVRKINSRNFTNARENCFDIVTNTALPSQKIDVIGYNAITTTGTSILILPGGLSKNGISGLGPKNTKFFYPQSSALTLDPLSPSFSEYLDTNPSDSDTGAYGAIGKVFYGDLFDGVWNFIDKELDLNNINYHLSRMLGCFGDGFMKMTQYYSHLFVPGTIPRSPAPPPPDDFTRIPVPTTLDWPYNTPGSGSDNTLYGQIYRGTRYGLINPTPLYPSCVFSGTGYGQFRDLLEQRHFSVFEAQEGSEDGVPVKVAFIDRETGTELPVGEYSGTNSINLSPYCTSSLPYFDGHVRDRDLPLPEQSIYYVPVFPTF